MPKDKTLVTLVVGDSYLEKFRGYCVNSWQEYAARHNYDLVVFDQPLDTSVRAANRSPAWQKCLVFGRPELQKYKQVAWVDADILINSATAPDLFETVPVDKVGAVESYGYPLTEEFKSKLKALYTYWNSQNLPHEEAFSAQEFYINWGLPPRFDKVVQTGVMIASPEAHREIFLRAYNNYEDKGLAQFNYEMRPLSYELMAADAVYWIDRRFNTIWVEELTTHYPFLLGKNNFSDRLEYMASSHFKPVLMLTCATTIFLNSFFLHFAGGSDSMRYVDASIKSVFDL